MSISESIGPGNPTSAVTTPTNTVSEVSVGVYNKGVISVEQMVPGGQWRPIDIISNSGVIETPDPAVSYRFNSVSLEGDIHVYFGP
jgi:hypothetical protein